MAQWASRSDRDAHPENGGPRYAPLLKHSPCAYRVSRIDGARVVTERAQVLALVGPDTHNHRLLVMRRCGRMLVAVDVAV